MKGFLPFPFWLWLLLFTVVLYAGPTGSADSISCSLLCFWLYWTRKDGLLVDIWGLFCSWWSLSLFFFLFFFHVFNFTTLTDTLLDINCKNSGNQAAVLSHTIAVHSQHYWLQRIIYSALLIAEYIHYNLTVNVIYCKLYRLDDCFLLSTKKTEKE